MHPARGSKTVTEAAPAGAARARRESLARRHRLLRPAISVALAALLAVLAASAAHGHAAASPSRHALGAVASSAPAALAKPHTAPTGQAAVGLFTASPATLPAGGGTVHLVAVVQGATICSFTASRTLSHLPQTKACASGSASVSVTVPKNASAAARTFRFQLVVRGRRGTAVAAPVAVVERAPARAGAPVITTQPVSRSAVVGATVTLTAAAKGTPRVQWELSTNGGRSWGDIAGADSPSLSFVAASGDANDEFRAVFTSHGRSTTTSVATLTISAASGSAPPPPASAAASPASANTPAPAPDTAPVITEQPTGAGITLGNPATFSAQASGVPAPSVQWQASADGVDWTNIAGATSSSYSFTPALYQSGYEYRAVFTNSVGSVTTNAVLLDVSTETLTPQILTQPQNETVVAGQQVSFTATAEGVPTPTVQWQQSTDGVIWTTIPGATSTTYSFTSSDIDSGYLYRAEFSNSAGQADSGAARLTVSVPVAPTITEEPVSQQIFVGATATFNAAATGNPSPSTQWMVSTDGGATWNAVPGATSTSYSFTPTLADSGEEYEAVFDNGYGSATTNPATLTVAVPESAPQITTEPTSQSVVIGAYATFTAAASGNPVPTVQWQVSTDNGDTWGNVSGGTSTSYAVLGSGADNGYEFRAIFSNSVGSQATNTVRLTVGGDQSTSNWSGYVATGTSYTTVSGSWTVPTVTCPSYPNQYASFWIGIDGKGSPSVEQDGTDSDCLGGQPNYYAWYEMYGDPSVSGGNSVTLPDHVAAGDAINAQVSVSGSFWTLYIHDATENWTESIPITWSGAQQLSAEWIAERPELCSNTCSYSALSDFGSVTFSGASANGQSIAALNASPFEMTNGSTLLALPSGLNGAGNGFTDSWYASN
jgi:hypothetical protein